MATNKKSFILYCDQRGVWDKLDEQQAGRLIKHIFAYVNDENPVAPDFVTELAFEPIKAILKRDLKKWEVKQEQRTEAGRRSAEIRKQNATKANDRSTTVNDRSISSTVNGSVSGNVSDSVNVEQDYILESFNLFWELYGKKLDKVKCQREWSEIDKSEYPKIIDHVPKFVKASGQYLCKPLNYLQGRRWQDEQLPNYNKNQNEKPKERFIPTPPKV